MQALQGRAGPDGEPRGTVPFGIDSGVFPASMGPSWQDRLRSVDQPDEVRSEGAFFWPFSGAVNAPRPAQAKAERLTGPVQFILKLLEFWCLNRDDAVSLLGFDDSDADHVKAVLEGSEQFRGRDVKDRIVQLHSIRKSLWSLFQDLDAENDWLREPQSLLEGKTPLALLSSSMEDLLWLRDHVDEMAGR